MTEELKKLLLPILSDLDAELVEIQLKGRPGNQTIKVFVDCLGGTTLEKCERISRGFSDVLEMADVIEGHYRLEVSSPGLGRPLRNSRDFLRHLNEEVDVVYEDRTGATSVHGKILAVERNSVQISCKKDVVAIPVSKIKQGKLSLPW